MISSNQIPEEGLKLALQAPHAKAEPLSEVAADEEASRDDARHERQYHLQVALKRARPQHEYYFSRHFLRLNS